MGCLLIATLANAYEVPADAVIKVFDANGNQIGEMSRAEYKVVKIENDVKLQQVRKENKDYKEKHSSVILHAGKGNNGMHAHTDGTTYTVHDRETMVFGLTYCYTKNTVGLCGTGITNETFLLGVKKDF